MKKTTTPTPSAQLTPSWDLLPKSFALVKEHYVIVMYLLLIPSLFLALGGQLLGKLDEKGTLHVSSTTGIGAALCVIGLVWSIVNIGPSTLFELRASQGKTYSLRQYYAKGLRFNFRLFGYYLLYGLFVICGLILFIVPGLIILRRYLLAGYYLVDNDSSIRDAMRRSAKESKPFSGRVWGVLGVQFAFSAAASALNAIPMLGIILSQLIIYIVLLLPALRYLEIKRASRTSPQKSVA